MWKRISKKINISNDYDAGKICQKFSDGILSLKMPKKVPLLMPLQQLGCKKVSLPHMKVGIELAWKFVIAVTVGVTLGAYVACKYFEPSHAKN